MTSSPQGPQWQNSANRDPQPQPSAGYPQMPPGPYGQPQYQPAGYGYGSMGRAPLRTLVVGPLLMILGVAASQVALWLPWNPGFGSTSDGEGISFSSPMMSGWEQAFVNIRAERIYGYLMLGAFALVGLAGLLALIGAVLGFTGTRGRGPLSITGAILGLLGTVGVIAGYLVLGALHESAWGMWLYAGSFIPVLIGAIGVAANKF